MSDQVYWVLEVAVKDGEAENFKVLMKEMIDATRANEPGTINYEWAFSDDGKSCHIYERYADSAAAMKHVGAFGTNFAGRFMAAVTPTRFVVYGNADEQVKQALSGLGAVFMNPAGGFVRA